MPEQQRGGTDGKKGKPEHQGRIRGHTKMGGKSKDGASWVGVAVKSRSARAPAAALYDAAGERDDKHQLDSVELNKTVRKDSQHLWSTFSVSVEARIFYIYNFTQSSP